MNGTRIVASGQTVVSALVPPGHLVFVDKADAHLLLDRAGWHVAEHGYVRLRYREDGHQRVLYLHRLILNAPHGRYVDHINRVKTDNRRCNLRLVTQSENMQNRLGAQINSTTGVRGVSWDKARGLYEASVKLGRRKIHLGRFAVLGDAARAAAAGRERYMTHSREGEPQAGLPDEVLLELLRSQQPAPIDEQVRELLGGGTA